MKKILLFAATLFASAATQAQDVGLGVRAGLNYSRLTGDHAEDAEFRTGMHIGAIVSLGFSDALSVQPELNYSAKGYRQEVEKNNSETLITRERINYLDVPVLLNVKAGGLFFELGPQMSFVLSGKREIETIVKTNNEENSTTQTEDTKDNPYPIDFGYVAGLGYRFDNNVGIGLRYSGGIKDIDDEGPAEGQNRRHSLFQLSLSYLLGGY